MVEWIQQPAGSGQAATSSHSQQPHTPGLSQGQGELRRGADASNTNYSGHMNNQDTPHSSAIGTTLNLAPQLPAKDSKQRSSMAISHQQSSMSSMNGASDGITYPANCHQRGPSQYTQQHHHTASGSSSNYHDALPSQNPSPRKQLPSLDTSGRPMQAQQRAMPAQSPSSFPTPSSSSSSASQGQRTTSNSQIVSPIPQRRHLPSLPEPGEPSRPPSASDQQARPSSFFGTLNDTASASGSTISQQQQQQQRQTPQLRVQETERPRISSFFGGLDDHGAGLGPRSAGGLAGSDYVDSPISADEQPSRRYTPSPASSAGNQHAPRSAGPSTSRRSHLPNIPSQSSSSSTVFPTAGPSSQQAMYRSASQPLDARYGQPGTASTSQPPQGQYNPAQRSSFYGMEGHYPISSSIASTSNDPQSRARSEGRYSPGSSRAPSQSLPRSETGHSQYSTNQLQQERRRVSSWTTRSNPSSVYGLNALSQNLGGGGDTGSVNGVPPVPVLSQAHLRPGDRASLLSHQKTLEAYRANVKKTNDPDITYEFATFMLGIAKEMAQLEHSQQHGRSSSTQVSEENLLASLQDHSASPSPDPSMSFHSRSSGSSGDLHSSNSNSNGGLASGYGAALSSAAAGKRRTTSSQSPNPSSLHLSVHTNNTGGTASPPGTSPSTQSSMADRKALVNEAIALLKRNADRGHYQSQFFLADCYSQGIGTGRRGSNSGLKDFGIDKNGGQASTSNGDANGSNNTSPTTTSKPDYDKALMLYTSAAKHGHVPSYFRAGQCFENGWGCRKDSAKAVQFYRKAASHAYAAAMYRLGIAELNGELGLKDRQKEGFKWLKRVAELAETSGDEVTDAALIQQQQAQQNGGDQYIHEDPILLDPSNPLAEPSARACAVQALHELALLHERGIHNVVFVDNEYAAELLARASELGYAPSAYKLGECYEYGKMGCPQDSALSIHYYNIAAQQNHREACFALTAWYLVGSPGVLPQSDTEAYLWAKKAAEQGLAKAEYAVGYFTEVGIGTVRDEREAISWFRRAAEHGDKRAVTRLRTLGGVAMYPSPPNSPTKGKGSINEPIGGGSRMSVMGLGGKKNSITSNHRQKRSTMSGISSAGPTNGKKTDGDCLVM